MRLILIYFSRGAETYPWSWILICISKFGRSKVTVITKNKKIKKMLTWTNNKFVPVFWVPNKSTNFKLLCSETYGYFSPSPQYMGLQCRAASVGANSSDRGESCPNKGWKVQDLPCIQLAYLADKNQSQKENLWPVWRSTFKFFLKLNQQFLSSFTTEIKLTWTKAFTIYEQIQHKVHSTKTLVWPGCKNKRSSRLFN